MVPGKIIEMGFRSTLPLSLSLLVLSYMGETGSFWGSFWTLASHDVGFVSVRYFVVCMYDNLVVRCFCL